MPRRLFNQSAYLVESGYEVEAPTTPKQPNKRRRSISPFTRNLFSPIEISDTPVQRHDLRKEVVDRILKWSDEMCRALISPEYIRKVAKKSTSELWTIADSKGTIFGFAITEVKSQYVELHLICVMKRKGEGMRLFQRVLEYTRGMNKHLQLYPISKKVAAMYVDTAINMGSTVVYDEKEISLLPKDFESDTLLKMY